MDNYNNKIIDVCDIKNFDLENIKDFSTLEKPIYINKIYKIVEKVAEGGTSNIYKAINVEKNNIVALKIIKKKSKVVSAKQRFELEGRTLKEFESNPNILKIYEFFKCDENAVIVMEFLEGKTLKEIMVKEKIISPSRAINWIYKIINALKDLHAKNIMHRDLKPQNIIVNHDQLKLTDFGIVQASEDQDITQTNYVVGSVEYMAPEILKGQKSTPRSEIYSLGIIMYSMLSGVTPLKGMDFQDTAKKHLSEIPTELYILNPNLSKDLSKIVMKCLKSNDFERYSSVQELEQALLDFEQKENKLKNEFKNTKKHFEEEYNIEELDQQIKKKFQIPNYNYKFISILIGSSIIVIFLILVWILQ